MKNLCEHERPGKKNKLKIGDKVVPKQEWIDWHSSRISLLLSKHVHDDNSYGKGGKKIPVENLNEVAFLCFSKLGKKLPTGTIGHYGAEDNDKNIDRKNVWVEFKLNTELGELPYSCFVAEHSLEILNKKKSKK